jgi:hypothetical protein
LVIAICPTVAKAAAVERQRGCREYRVRHANDGRHGGEMHDDRQRVQVPQMVQPEHDNRGAQGGK